MPINLIDPTVLSSISQLELIARQAVEGTVSGLHHSHFMGRNVEFSEHRPYNPGDELRHIDWRAYAKTDRFHVKLFEEDTNLRGLILTDLSGSMRFGDSTITKLEYAQQLTAALSYLMIRQGDSVGLTVFDDQPRAFIPPRYRQDQWSTILESLVATQTSRAPSAISSVISQMGEQLKKRGIVILISDLIEDPKDVLQTLSILRKRQQELIVFQVLTPEEMNLPYHGTVDFQPLEDNDDALQTTPKRLKKAYEERVQQFLNTYRNGLLELDIDYTLVDTSRPLENLLREYLRTRFNKPSLRT